MTAETSFIVPGLDKLPDGYGCCHIDVEVLPSEKLSLNTRRSMKNNLQNSALRQFDPTTIRYNIVRFRSPYNAFKELIAYCAIGKIKAVLSAKI